MNPYISRRRFLEATAATAGAAAFAGRMAPVARAQDKKLKFVWSPKATDNPVFAVAQKGGEIRAGELGDVEFVWVGPSNTDAVLQASLLDAAITSGCDGMGISCNDATVLMPIIDRATAAGIPVITWDSDSPDSTRLSFYSIDGAAAATAGATRFAEVMKDNPSKTYALLSGNAGAPNLEQRIKDVRAVLDLPEHGLKYVTTLFCNDDSALGQQQMEDQLTATPDLGGFFLIGGWPLFADTAPMTKFLAATKAGTLKCVAWDTLSMQLPLLENGTVQGLIGQKYFGWGYDGIGIMYDHVKNKIELPPFIDSGFDLLTTPEQATEFAKKWETQNFVPEGGGKFGKGDASAYAAAAPEPS